MKNYSRLMACMAYLLCMSFFEAVEAKIEHAKAWTDIPDFSRISTPFSGARWFEEVSTLITSYHAVDKRNVENLPKRSSMLRDIAAMAGSVCPTSESPTIQRNLKHLATMANNREC